MVLYFELEHTHQWAGSMYKPYRPIVVPLRPLNTGREQIEDMIEGFHQTGRLIHRASLLGALLPAGIYTFLSIIGAGWVERFDQVVAGLLESTPLWTYTVNIVLVAFLGYLIALALSIRAWAETLTVYWTKLLEVANDRECAPILAGIYEQTFGKTSKKMHARIIERLWREVNEK